MERTIVIVVVVTAEQTNKSRALGMQTLKYQKERGKGTLSPCQSPLDS